MKSVITLLAIAGLAGAASAQTNPPQIAANSNLIFEVWNGSAWTNTVNAAPGASVDWRIRIVYTGTAPVVAFDGGRLQPYFSGADVSGASVDSLSAIRRNASNSVADLATGNTLFNQAEGGSAGSSGTGKVNFGGQEMGVSNGNVLTFFRHQSGERGAPTLASGGFLRISGSGGLGTTGTGWSGSDNNTADANAVWPGATATTATAQSNIVKGVAFKQNRPTFNNPDNDGDGSPDVGPDGNTFTVNPFFVNGRDVVLFRGEFVASEDLGDRTVTLTADSRSMQRLGTGTAPENRFFTWKNATDGDAGSIRSGVNFLPATIVIPSPASVALMGLGGLVAARRRRA